MPIKKKIAGLHPTSTPTAPKAKRAIPQPKKSAPASSAASPVARRLVYTPDFAMLAKEREEKLGPLLLPQALPGASQTAASVVGQCWVVLSATQKPPLKHVWTFFEDGTLNHGGSTVGIWRQQGAAIVTEINGRYSQYQGVINGQEAAGEANNITGLRWTWTATITG